MSQTKDIKTARQAGRIEEALQLAEAALAEAPQDRWVLREAAWVRHAFLKKAAALGDARAFRAHLEAIAALGLDLQAEPMLGNQVGWQAYALAKDWPAERAAELPRLLDTLRAFALDRAAFPLLPALLLRLALKAKAHYAGLPAFMDWCDLAQLPPDAYEPWQPQGGGRPIMALAEQAHIAYAKALLAAHAEAPAAARARIEAYLPLLARLIAERPAYEYPPYFRSQLLIAIGRPAEALALMLAFVGQHSRLTWSWAGLAATYGALGRADAQRACLGKAIGLGREEAFLVKLRPQLAELLLAEGERAAAKRELLIVQGCYEQQGWRVPLALERACGAAWFGATEAAPDNGALYRALGAQADALLLEGMPERIGVVSGVDAKLGRVYVLLGREEESHFRCPDAGTWAAGQAVALRTLRCEGAAGGYTKVLAAAPSEAEPPAELRKPFRGVLKRLPGKDFGFVGRDAAAVFVPPQLMGDLREGQAVAGLALARYDKAKARWGWAALRIAAQD